MANEITGIEGGTANSQGSVLWSLFFIYPVNTSIGGWRTPKQVGGSNVVPTPANEGGAVNQPTLLPEMVDRVITTAERNNLNSGDTMFVIVSFQRPLGMSNADLITRARELYANRKPSVQQEYDDRYEFSGGRINEV